MVIARMYGGLGNQMFIYAYIRSLQEKGIEAKLDADWMLANRDACHGTFYSEVFANALNSYAAQNECEKLAICQTDLFHRVIKKVFGNKKTYIMQERRYGDVGYNAELTELKDAYVEGYFQSEKYFKNISDKIRYEFSFSLPADYDDKYLKIIKSCNAVSIHIRRGDYVKTNKLLCETDYYKKAIDYFNENVQNPMYIVFSDDIEWCKAYFKDYDGEFIFVEGQIIAWMDMYLMTQCQHNIIADSSFSWWGAWLNANPEKKVFCPENWYASHELKISDIHCEGWIRG